MGEVIYMHSRELSNHQREHWEEQLEIAQRTVEYALRMLGRLPVEEEIEQEGVHD